MRIFCEGEDDKNFIIQLLKHLENTGQLNAKPEYTKYIIHKRGKSALLKTENYTAETKSINKKIKKALFIFDADFADDNRKTGGLKKSKECIQNLIRELNWNIPTDYYIFDNNLDDFIMSTLDSKECFAEFDRCLKITEKNKNKKISTCIYKKLYPKTPYDFEHKNFDSLKSKLKELFK